MHWCPENGTGACTSTYGSESDGFSLVGTSQAAPIVTGLAALMFSVSPEATPAQVEACIVDTADEIIPDEAPPTVNAVLALLCIQASNDTNDGGTCSSMIGYRG